MLDRRDPPRPDAHPRGRAGRVRYTLALVALVAALLAVSAMFKRETCGCSGPGVPYGTIAIVAAMVAGLGMAAYVATGFVARRP